MQFSAAMLDEGEALPADVLLARVADSLEAEEWGAAGAALRQVVDRLRGCYDNREDVDVNLLVGTTRHLLSLAEATEAPEWIELLFGLHKARGAPVDGVTIAKLRPLIADMPRKPSGYPEYMERLRARESEMPFEQKVLVRRLEGLSQLGL